VEEIWLETKLPTLRRLKKLGMESWVEPGGLIAARYTGKYPFSNMPADEYSAGTEWKHNWHLRCFGDQQSVLACWANYMVCRITTVLKLKYDIGCVTLRRPKIVTTPSDWVFVIHA